MTPRQTLYFLPCGWLVSLLPDTNRTSRASGKLIRARARTAGHSYPEAYPVVERILACAGKGIAAVMRHPDLLKGLSPSDFTDDRFDVLTVGDIFAELESPAAALSRTTT